MSLLRFHALGDWPPGSVRVRSTGREHVVAPELAGLVEAAWHDATQVRGKILYDGPLCRLEGWSASGAHLELELGLTSYKRFVGTNIAHPQLADRLGWSALANPLGASAALVSSDDRLLMGVRNDWVAYYPRRVHPFAGAIEPAQDLDVFAEMRRELKEELSLSPDEIPSIRCAGLMEDVTLRQPELIFLVRASLGAAAIEQRLDRLEHRAVWSIPCAPDDMRAALALRDTITPVGLGAILLLGRSRFGEEWFAVASAGLMARV